MYPPARCLVISFAACLLFIGIFPFDSLAQEYMPPVLEKLSPGINTPDYDETAPVVSRDGSVLFFTRTAFPDFDRTLMNGKENLAESLPEPEYLERLARIYSQLSGKTIADPVNSAFNQDIWMASTDIDAPEVAHPGYPVNSALPNSIVSVDKDTHSYVAINQFYSDGSMYEGFSSVYIEDAASTRFPEPIHIYHFDARQGDVNLAMSADGDILVISMKRYDSFGENDLYVSFRLKEKLYSTPKNMGPVLNSAGQETTPYISADKRKIYFSSNREGSLGGNDIWVSERQDYSWKKWSEPAPLDEPFNSTADDSQPFFDEVNNYMYFSSKRDGSSDLFRVSLTPVPKIERPISISGRIMDRSTGKVIPAELFWGPGSAEGFLEFFRTNTGYFTVTLTENEFYKFMPRKANYRAEQIHFDVLKAAEKGVYDYEMTLYLDPMNSTFLVNESTSGKEDQPVDEKDRKVRMPETRKPDGEESPELKFIRESDLKVGRKISFHNIIFLQSTPTILERSAPALEELAYIMQQNPTLEIRVEGHTDNVGDSDKNMELSVQRAEAIKKYLVDKGIDISRVQTKGYGPYSPITNNATEEQRARNRRVEIRILKE